MSAKDMERDMRALVNGESLITIQELCKFLRSSRNTTLKIVASVPKVGGRFYYIPEVAKALCEGSAEGDKHVRKK